MESVLAVQLSLAVSVLLLRTGLETGLDGERGDKGFVPMDFTKLTIISLQSVVTSPPARLMRGGLLVNEWTICASSLPLF